MDERSVELRAGGSGGAQPARLIVAVMHGLKVTETQKSCGGLAAELAAPFYAKLRPHRQQPISGSGQENRGFRTARTQSTQWILWMLIISISLTCACALNGCGRRRKVAFCASCGLRRRSQNGTAFQLTAPRRERTRDMSWSDCCANRCTVGSQATRIRTTRHGFRWILPYVR